MNVSQTKRLTDWNRGVLSVIEGFAHSSVLLIVGALPVFFIKALIMG